MTDLFTQMIEAKAAFNADLDANPNGGDLTTLRALEAAERAYFDAEAKAREAWEALPEGEAKDSAELNASDTMSENGVPNTNRLFFFEIAVRSYECLVNA